MKLLNYTLFFVLMAISLMAQANQNPIRSYRLSGILFSGEGGGWNPSLSRCQRYADSLQSMVSFRSDQGFLEFTGLCTEGGFETRMASTIRSNLPLGHYVGPTYCAVSDVIEIFQSRARIISTENVQLVVVKLKYFEHHCEQGSRPFQTEIYFQ